MGEFWHCFLFFWDGLLLFYAHIIFLTYAVQVANPPHLPTSPPHPTKKRKKTVWFPYINGTIAFLIRKRKRKLFM